MIQEVAFAALPFRTGERVYLPGGSGEPTGLSTRVLQTPDLRITTSFAPGINRLDGEMIGAGTIVSGLFMQPGLTQAQRDRRYRHMPMSYAAMVKWLHEAPPFETCFVQVAPPDAQGRCSLGPAAEFLPVIMRRATRIVAVVNTCVPRMVHSASLALADCACVVAATAPLATYYVEQPDDRTSIIARCVAAQIADGAALQIGLGKLPHAILQALTRKNGLRLHSGMISDGVMALAQSGALDDRWQHVGTVVLGSADLYDWVQSRMDIHVRGVEYTHDVGVLSRIEGFVAVNSALEVDLFGQCNLESANGRAVSGAGGAPDFARAARLSRNGTSIIALPSTFGGGMGSRVRASLDPGSVISLPRTDVDIVVTEHGTADLRGRSVHERADALIGVAPPAFRDGLREQWQDITARL